MQNERKGIIAALIAYMCWGLFPLYWKALAGVGSEEILASRVIWSFILTFEKVMRSSATSKHYGNTKNHFGH